MDDLKNCHDCKAKPGDMHMLGCDTERCAMCGGQAISCHCVYEVTGVNPDPDESPGVYENGPTEAMWETFDEEIEKLGGRLPWTGVWPGKVECIEFGWYARFVEGQGWVTCSRHHPEATPNLNRLVAEARWDRVARRWVKP